MTGPTNDDGTPRFIPPSVPPSEPPALSEPGVPSSDPDAPTPPPFINMSAAVPPPPPPGVTSPRNSGLALSAMIVGIAAIPAACACGIGFIAGIVAIVLAVLAKRQINEANGTLGGSGMATAGLVCGIVAAVMGGLYLGWLAVSITNR